MPRLARILKRKQRWVALVASGCVKNLGVLRINRESHNCTQRVGIGNKALVRMVRSHHDRFDLRGIWIYEVPGVPRVGASPQSGGLRVHHFWIERVEDEKA